jgi:hypothetical protein
MIYSEVTEKYIYIDKQKDSRYFKKASMKSNNTSTSDVEQDGEYASNVELQQVV